MGPVQRKAITSTPDCAVRAQNCRLQTVTLVLVILICALLILYILLWFWYMWRAYRDLQKHQYMHYKMGNLNVRMQVSPSVSHAARLLSAHSQPGNKPRNCHMYLWFICTPHGHWCTVLCFPTGQHCSTEQSHSLVRISHECRRETTDLTANNHFSGKNPQVAAIRTGTCVTDANLLVGDA